MKKVYFNPKIKPSAGVVIMTPEGIILVIEKKENFTFRYQGEKRVDPTFYKIPGGRNSSVDVDIRDTAIREVFEETGIDLFYKRDQLKIIDVLIRKGFRHTIFFIKLSFIPILKIRNEIEDIIIVSPDEWRRLREENKILDWHANLIEKNFPEFKGFIQPAYV